MKSVNCFKLSLLLLLLIPGVNSAADRVGDFSLLDQLGVFHQMSWYDDHAAVALLVQANGNETSSSAVATFDALKTRFESQGIEFFMLNPMGLNNRDAVQQEVLKYGAEIPVLMDDTQLIAEALGIDKIGEVFVFDPKSFVVEFRGPVGTKFEQALVDIVAGNEVSDSVVAMQGSPVSFAASRMHQQNALSYEKDIAPIIADNCATCHREGGAGPFALNSHSMLQGWSPMIREVLMTKRMPPAQVDSHVGKFLNGRILDDASTQKLVHWIEAGSVKDGTTDPLAELSWPATQWAFGEPDYIIKVPPQTIPATGVLDYRYLSVPLDLEKDVWVRGSQYLAGDPTVLHHTLNSIVPPGAEQRGGFVGGGDSNEANIAAYIPGAEPSLEPPNTGGLLQAGSTLNLQLHYTTSGRESVDAGEIGLWFYPEGVIPEERMSGQCACIFTADWTDIPPFDPAFEQTQTITVPKDAHIYSMLSHMHFRGKSMRFYADYPDGSGEELLNIADYNYAWQLAYALEEPKFVPAGTRITVVGVFDNSAQNPANPDPSRAVPWGQQSWDEMFFGSVRWKYVDQGGN